MRGLRAIREPSIRRARGEIHAPRAASPPTRSRRIRGSPEDETPGCPPGRRAGRCAGTCATLACPHARFASARDIQRGQLAQDVPAARAGQQELRVDRRHVRYVDGRRQQQIRRRRESERSCASTAVLAPPDRRSPDSVRARDTSSRRPSQLRRRLQSITFQVEFHHPAHVAQADTVCELLGFLLGEREVRRERASRDGPRSSRRTARALWNRGVCRIAAMVTSSTVRRRIVERFRHDTRARRAAVHANLDLGSFAGRRRSHPRQADSLPLAAANSAHWSRVRPARRLTRIAAPSSGTASSLHDEADQFLLRSGLGKPRERVAADEIRLVELCDPRHSGFVRAR